MTASPLHTDWLARTELYRNRVLNEACRSGVPETVVRQSFRIQDLIDGIRSTVELAREDPKNRIRHLARGAQYRLRLKDELATPTGPQAGRLMDARMGR